MGVLKAATRNRLVTMFPRSVTAVVDGWCATNPKQVKEWEASGQLNQKAQEVADQTERANLAYQHDQQSNPAMPALSQSEINEIYGGPSCRL